MPEAAGPWEWGQHAAPLFAAPLVPSSKTAPHMKRGAVRDGGETGQAVPMDGKTGTLVGIPGLEALQMNSSMTAWTTGGAYR